MNVQRLEAHKGKVGKYRTPHDTTCDELQQQKQYEGDVMSI